MSNIEGKMQCPIVKFLHGAFAVLKSKRKFLAYSFSKGSTITRFFLKICEIRTTLESQNEGDNPHLAFVE